MLSLEDYLSAESDADEILRTFNVYAPPVPSDIIKRIFPGASLDVISFSDEAYGFTFEDDGKWRILINSNLPLGAKRFTIFHELHHMLYSEEGFCMNNPKGQINERVANVFSANILMPARWFRKYWEIHRDIDQMAKIFVVSPRAVAIRLSNLNNYLNA